MVKIILPIQNGKAALLKGPTLYLDDNTRIDKLSDEEYGLVSKSPPQYAELIHTEHRCVFIELEDIKGVDLELYVSKLSTRTRFVFNALRGSDPLLITFAVLITTNRGAKGKKNKIEVVDLGQDYAHAKEAKSTFNFKAGTARGTLSAFYKLVSDACEKYGKLYLTLGRYNSSLTRPRQADQIIDATISLESMVQDDKNELNFKFALFNSYAASRDKDKRIVAFQLLKKLYNTRSTIVHGATDEVKEQRMVEEVMEQWAQIEDLALKAIKYKIFFVNENDPKKWTEHLLAQILEGKEHLHDKESGGV